MTYFRTNIKSNPFQNMQSVYFAGNNRNTTPTKRNIIHQHYNSENKSIFGNVQPLNIHSTRKIIQPQPIRKAICEPIKQLNQYGLDKKSFLMHGPQNYTQKYTPKKIIAKQNGQNQYMIGALKDSDKKTMMFSTLLEQKSSGNLLLKKMNSQRQMEPQRPFYQRSNCSPFHDKTNLSPRLLKQSPYLPQTKKFRPLFETNFGTRQRQMAKCQPVAKYVKSQVERKPIFDNKIKHATPTKVQKQEAEVREQVRTSFAKMDWICELDMSPTLNIIRKVY